MHDFADENGGPGSTGEVRRNRFADAPDGGTRSAAIQAAALGLWSASPYQAVSLRRIAERAGVGLALIDHHYGSKERLLEAVLLPLGKQVLAAVAQSAPVSPAPDLDTALRQAVRLLTDTVDQVVALPQGEGLMRLWLLHRYERAPEIHTPLSRALAPLFHQLHEGLRPHLTASGPLKAQPVLQQALAAVVETGLFWRSVTAATEETPVEAAPCDPRAAVVLPVLRLLFSNHHAA